MRDSPNSEIMEDVPSKLHCLLLLRRSKSTGSASELDALLCSPSIWTWSNLILNWFCQNLAGLYLGATRQIKPNGGRSVTRFSIATFNHLITRIVRAEHSSCGTMWPSSIWGIQMRALQKSHKAARQRYWFPHQTAVFTNVALYRHALRVALKDSTTILTSYYFEYFDGIDVRLQLSLRSVFFFSFSCALSPIPLSAPLRYQSNLFLSVTSLCPIRKGRAVLLSRNGCSSSTSLTQTQVPLLHLYKNSFW